MAYGFWRILQFVLTVLILIASVVMSTGMVYFCITLGATVVKKAKIVAAIGIYYLMNTVFSMVGQVVGTVSLIFIAIGFAELVATWSPDVLYAVITLIMFVALAAISSVAAIFYCATQNLLERKLNLA
jgi:hypothetical protein